jgi:AAA ATPase domain
MAGRDAVIEDILDGLETGPGHPEYTTVLTGPRGVGKTVVLNEVQRRAQEMGWLVVALDASSGQFVQALVDACRALEAAQLPSKPRRRVKGVRAVGVGIDFALAAGTVDERGLRALLTALGTVLAQNDAGLLITVDELHSATMAELSEFGSVIQHVTKREGHPIAFAAAALAQIEDELARGDDATFLHRCAWHELDQIPIAQVAAAIRATIEHAGRAISAPALMFASQATSGYAFMVQLVGHHMWNAARDASGPIGLDHARLGVTEAEKRMGRQVFAPQWKVLSDVDRAFLRALALDDDPVRIAEIARRMERSPQYVNTYRDRLIRSGWIRPARRGVVELSHQAAREWIVSHPEIA